MRLVFAIPGDLSTPTGGYAYDRRIIAELEKLGFAVPVLGLGDGFPFPAEGARASALASLGRLPPGVPLLIDGLAFGALPELAATVCRGRPVVALIHHPLACESGLSAETADRLRDSERAALAGARRVVVTSRTTAGLLIADYAVPADRLAVAPPGSDRVAPAAAQRRADGPVRLLAVGAVVPRKAYDVLVAALARVVDLDWRLTIAGALDRDSACAARLAAQIEALGLGDRITLAGAVGDDTLAALYAGADAFVLASRFEGYGMVFSEAAVYGLPMIGTTGGAVPETIPAGAGLTIAPDDVDALATALRQMIGDPDLRARLAAAARAGAARLPTWTESAGLIAATIEAAASEAAT